MKQENFKKEFEEVWSLFPRKRGKAQSFRYYKKWRKNGTPKETFLRAIENYTREIERDRIESRYVMYGSTFFGPNERFRDYLGVEGEMQVKISGKQKLSVFQETSMEDPDEILNQYFKGD